MPTPRTLLGVAVLVALLMALVQCRSPGEKAPPTKPKAKVTRAEPSIAPTPDASAIASTPPAVEPPSPHPPADTEGCPEGMVRVHGEYCPGVIQTCDKHHQEYRARKGSATVSERCLRYIEPSRCVVDKRQPMDFCIDRYEYPNRVGEMPWVLTSWRQAQRMCREQGKRLCTEEEFNFACEGPEMLPYVNGYVRDAEKCNIDKEYHTPDHTKQLLTYERCLEDEACKAELERLDQRHAIGSRVSCVSWAGAVDLNGNVNEWVSRRNQEPPNRSGLKGGWWGPVRNRCRPTVRFHKEFDYGYEAGFRCCKGHGQEKVDPRYDQERYKVSPEELQARKADAPQPKAEAKPSEERASKPGPTNTAGTVAVPVTSLEQAAESSSEPPALEPNASTLEPNASTPEPDTSTSQLPNDSKAP